MQIKRLPLTALLIACFLHQEAKAQFSDPYNFKFRSYTVKDGLVHNFVRKCQSDSKGFLWVITQNGLSRFDGFGFRNFQHIQGDSTSLPYNDLNDITIDKQDRIWLAYDAGLCFYDPNKGRFYSINSSLTQTKIFALCYDKTGDIVWAASRQGLLRINTVTLAASESSLKGKFQNDVSSLTIDTKRRLWITVHRNGVFRYDAERNNYISIGAGPWPMQVYEDYRHRLWLATWQAGFQKFNGETTPAKADVFYMLPMDETGNAYIFQAVAQCRKLTGDDILWVAMHEEGIGLFSISQSRFIHHFVYNPNNKSGLLSNYNNYTYEAPDGTLWICSWFGLTKLNFQEQQFRSAELPELSKKMYNCVSGLADDPDHPRFTWMSINGMGLIQYDREENKIAKRYYYLNKGFPTKDRYYMQRWALGLLKDCRNTLWSASYGGLIEIKNSRPIYHAITHNGRSLAAVAFGYTSDKLWLAGDEIIAEFDPLTHQYQTHVLPDALRSPVAVFDITESLCEGGVDSIFYSSWSGLFLFNAKTKTFSTVPYQYPAAEKSLWQRVKSILRIDSILYVGTDGGLAAINLHTHESTIIGREANIFKAEAHSFIADSKKRLWLNTLHGLYRYDPANKIFQKFTTADGLYNSSSDPVYLFNYRDDIFIGYRMAYTRFNPIEVDENNSLPVPYITAVTIKERKAFINPQRDTALALHHTNNDVAFEITAIEYNNPERLQFRYKLEGYDKAWSTTYQRHVKYTNLPAGTYHFLVKAKNSSGIWSKSAAIYVFSILPPLWGTWWFRLTMVAAIVSGLLLLYKNHITRLRKKQLLQLAQTEALHQKEMQLAQAEKKLIETELALLRSQMNPHFIFNSLNSIQKYIWEAKEEAAAEYLSRFAKLIRAILENSRKEVISLAEEIQFLKLYMELEHRRSNGNFDYRILIDEALDQQTTLIPPLLIQPFIENAIWHGLNKKNNKGQLTVSVEQKTSMLVCTIDDDGVGRGMSKNDKPGANGSLGINITTERIERMAKNTGHHATVTIQDKTINQQPAGTCVTLVLPLLIQNDYA